jgi:Zinc carboxypeptidase
MSAVRVWMWTFTITVLQVHVHVFQGVLLSFVASVILSAPPSSSASSWSSSSLEHGSSFPGVYTLKTNGHWQQWKDTHDYKNKSIHNVSRDCVWLHMDVLHIECLFENNEKKNTSHEDPSLCYIHSLIQTPREYEHLMSLIKEEEEEDARSSFSPQLVFNHSLTQEWIEPRLQIKRIHESNNNTTETRRFLNEDGYSYIATRECYLDYEGMMEWIQDYIQEASATGLLKLKWKDIGDSYLKTQNSEKGNDINVLTITGANTNTSTAAPLVLMSSIHAREYAPPELVRRWLLHILEYTQENGRVPPYLETTRIHWFPYVNVDGRLKAETTEPWRRKNMNSDWNSKSDICANDAYGVDLNRNYPFQWGFGDGSSDDACSPFSRGMEPASEPETQAVVNYAAKIFPQSQQEQAFSIQSRTDPKDLPTDWKGYDEATTMGVFVDLHSYGQREYPKWKVL